MNLGNNLSRARKKCGLSQEEVAERLGVSRQTISKWETDETLPDIRQSKWLALLYHMTLDELIDFDADVQEIEEAILRTSQAAEEKIDWTRAWGKKYPILLRYPKEVDTAPFAARLDALLKELRTQYGYSELDAFLVLKDILAQAWKARGAGAVNAPPLAAFTSPGRLFAEYGLLFSHTYGILLHQSKQSAVRCGP